MENIFRIKSYPDGWVVEIQKRKWYGKKYWTHFISVAGMDSKRLPDCQPKIIRFEGEVHIAKWSKENNAFMVGECRFPPTLYAIEWLDESATPSPAKTAEDLWALTHPIDLGIVTKEDAIEFAKYFSTGGYSREDIEKAIRFGCDLCFQTGDYPLANDKDDFIASLTTKQ